MHNCNRCGNWYDTLTCDCHRRTTPCYNPCPADECSCIEYVQGTCVKYQSATTSCLGIAKGYTYDQIIGLIDTKLCTLGASALQTVYNVVGTSNQITSTSSTVGNTVTYTLALSPTITNHLTTLDGQVLALQDCCNQSLKTITTNTPANLVLTQVGSNVNIDYQDTTTGFGGIVTNDVQKQKVPSNTANFTVLTKNINFVTAASADQGDVIEFFTTFQLGSGDGFSFIFQNGSTTFYNPFLTSFGESIDAVKLSATGRIRFNLTSTDQAVATSEFSFNNVVNENSTTSMELGNNSMVATVVTAVRSDITGIDLSAFKVIVKLTNANTTQNAVFGELESRIIKKII